jgi:cytochrome b
MAKTLDFAGLTATRKGADTWEWTVRSFHWALVGKPTFALFKAVAGGGWVQVGRFDSLQAAMVWTKGFVAGFDHAAATGETGGRR